MSLHLHVHCAEFGLFRVVLRPRCRPAPCLAPTALRRALGQLWALWDRNQSCTHHNVAIGAHGGLPHEDHFLAAALDRHGAPVSLVSCHLHTQLAISHNLGGIKEADRGLGGVRPDGATTLYEVLCGPPVRKRTTAWNRVDDSDDSIFCAGQGSIWGLSRYKSAPRICPGFCAGRSAWPSRHVRKCQAVAQPIPRLQPPPSLCQALVPACSPHQ